MCVKWWEWQKNALRVRLAETSREGEVLREALETALEELQLARQREAPTTAQSAGDCSVPGPEIRQKIATLEACVLEQNELIATLNHNLNVQISLNQTCRT